MKSNQQPLRLSLSKPGLRVYRHSLLQEREPSAPRRRTISGFTLLEVLIALAVIAIAFVTLLGWHARSIRTIAYNQSLGRATLLARERASLVQFEVLKNGLQGLKDEAGPIDGYPAFSYDQQVLSTGVDEMRQVVIRIIWDQRNPSACEVTFFVRDPAI